MGDVLFKIKPERITQIEVKSLLVKLIDAIVVKLFFKLS